VADFAAESLRFAQRQQGDSARKKRYIQTRFFRFLVLLRKNTSHAAKSVYTFAPIQDFDESWNDKKLYKKYGLTKAELNL